MQKLERWDVEPQAKFHCPEGLSCDIAQAAELLRPLRLHHWLLALRYSELRVEAEAAGTKDVVKRVHERYVLHMGFVQQLNEFFDVGDTAERDAENG